MVNTILKEADLFCPNSVRINFTIYLKHSDATIEEFSDEAYISLTKAYKVRKAVRHFFKAYQIQGV
ncbi:ABC transporter ATP-binding protein [Latilactobacillus curvatus]|uniref:hypothetical protein n=1 Tax=Latilactobacillus curvatus TaxID=28038 RepID=UPI0021A908E0|nr:hypothetical protein [Latilactobacillus curvatus]MCT3358751.1 ABC transporter ATP-binding protein [Latilactobacillus curvatus]